MSGIEALNGHHRRAACLSVSGTRAVYRRSLAARIAAQTTPGRVVVVAKSPAIGSSSALPAAAWITARIHRNPRDTA